MPTKCSICIHPSRASIDQALVSNVPLRTLEARHAETNRSALHRHRKHIAPALTQARQAQEVAEADSLLSRIKRITSRCERFLDRAEQSGENLEIAAAFREMHRYLELLGKISGELRISSPQIAITLNQIQNLDVSLLTKEQVGALYDRVEAERLREVQQMSDSEIEASMRELLGLPAALALGGTVPNTPGKALPQVIEGQ